MEVEFADNDLDRLEVEVHFTAGYGREVIRGFRKAMQVLRAAPDERDFSQIEGTSLRKASGSEIASTIDTAK